MILGVIESILLKVWRWLEREIAMSGLNSNQTLTLIKLLRINTNIENERRLLEIYKKIMKNNPCLISEFLLSHRRSIEEFRKEKEVVIEQCQRLKIAPWRIKIFERINDAI